MVIVVEDNARSLRWVVLPSGKLLIPYSTRRLLAPPSAVIHIIAGYATSGYKYFPFNRLTHEGTVHCTKGLGLLIPHLTRRSIPFNANPVLCSKKVYRQPLASQGHLVFVDRAKLHPKSWMTTRVMDFVLAFMNFDGYFSESIHVVPPFYATLGTATMEM
jgi:hypothetical protein